MEDVFALLVGVLIGWLLRHRDMITLSVKKEKEI